MNATYHVIVWGPNQSFKLVRTTSSVNIALTESEKRNTEDAHSSVEVCQGFECQFCAPKK